MDVMERYALAWLSDWKKRPDRKPLIVRGARQVGKTELVRIFARREFDTLIELNLDETPGKARYFDGSDLSATLRFLEIDTGKTINPGSTLIFLDEIQAAPELLAKLRYFHERRPDLHVICAGSLLDFALAEPEHSIPVGRIEFMYLGPLSYGEFLHARGERPLLDFLSTWHIGDPFPEELHRRARNLLREFFIVGGMPGVVKPYIESDRDPHIAARAQAGILQTFSADFGTYKRRADVPLLQEIFRRIPALIGKTTKYTALHPHARAREIKGALALLEKARLIHHIAHSDGNGIPLAAEADDSVFKLLFLDIGLLASILGIEATHLARADDLTLVNEGAMAEQFVGQQLLYMADPYRNPELHYWNRPRAGSTAEVDYLIQLDRRVLPVEVKAGATGRLRSLHMFIQEKRVPLALRLNDDIPSNLRTHSAIAGTAPVEFTLLSLPLYMAEQSRRIIAKLDTP